MLIPEQTKNYAIVILTFYFHLAQAAFVLESAIHPQFSDIEAQQDVLRESWWYTDGRVGTVVVTPLTSVDMRSSRPAVWQVRFT
jgi:hypothetical protein